MNPFSLSYKFLAEARRLWEIKQGIDKLTTIHASVMLNVTLNLSSVDKVGGTGNLRFTRLGPST